MRNLQGLIKRDALDKGGWCHQEKRLFFHDLILTYNLKTAVEIGVYKGSSLLACAEAIEFMNGTITGIDPWFVDSFVNEFYNWTKEARDKFLNEVLKGQPTLDKMYVDLLKIIQDNRLESIIKLIRAKSEDCVSLFKPGSLDLLHIDGNHDMEYVVKDVVNYLPLVKNGGFVVMDDISWPGVNFAVTKYLAPYTSTIVSNDTFGCYQVNL
jgi:predicted O-methyltransferase YrrM